MKATYHEILEMIIDYQCELSKALISYNYEMIEIYSQKIAVLIRKILNENLMKVEK